MYVYPPGRVVADSRNCPRPCLAHDYPRVVASVFIHLPVHLTSCMRRICSVPDVPGLSLFPANRFERFAGGGWEPPAQKRTKKREPRFKRGSLAIAGHWSAESAAPL